MATDHQTSPLTTVFLHFANLNLPCRALTLPSHLPLSHLSESLTLPPASFYFTSNGKLLHDSSLLSSASGHVTVHLRLRGGGGDGGATGAESRDCYLKMYLGKKPDKVDPNETRLSKWTTCRLSGEPLAPPVVIDRLGNLYNKEALVEALLHKRLPKALKHIRGLKDMLPVHLETIPGENGDAETRFQCPVTGLQFNGKYPFFTLRTCGHVLSVKAMKEVKTSASVCLVCHKEFAEEDKIAINGSDDEVEVLRERMEAESGKVKDKKERKEKNGLAGSKHVVTEKENGRKDGGGKRFKAVDIAPANATKEVYASIFTSSQKREFKETYSCRSLPLGRN